MGVILGIDYGMLGTKVSYVDENGKLCDVTFFDGLPYMASAACTVDGGTGVVVGNDALAEGYLSPENLMQHSKNYLGCDTDFTSGDKTFTAGDILFLVLQKAIEETEASLNGVPIDGAYVSCPAYFGECARDEIRRTAEKVVLSNGEHLRVMGLVDDPVATVTAYCNALSSKSDGRIKKRLLIYDLGGAFDVTVASVDFDGNDKRINILAIHGDHMFGVDEWKNVVTDIIIHKFSDLTGTDSDDLQCDYEFRRRAGNASERVLKALRRRDQIEVTVAYNGEKERIGLTREEIFDATEHLINTTVSYVDCALNECGLTCEDIDEILSCGGGATLPELENYLSAYYGPKNVILDSVSTVARGAALVGAGNAPAVERRRFSDGIEIGNDKFNQTIISGIPIVGMMTPTFLWDYYIKVGDAAEYHLMLRRGDEIPNRGEVLVRTDREDQTELVIRIFEVCGDPYATDSETYEPYEISVLELKPGLPKGAELRITLEATSLDEMILSVEDVTRNVMMTVKPEHKKADYSEDDFDIFKLNLD